MIEIYKTWIRDMGIDGFRIDTMKHVNDEFWQAFAPEILEYAQRQGKRDFFMFGEVFDTTKSFTSHFTTHDDVQAVLDFPFQDVARRFAASQPTDTLRDFFAGDDWYTDADSNVYQLPTFLGNHDMGRIGSFVRSDNPGATDAELVARDRLAHELMYLSRGNPVVYYGDEQGFTGSGGDQFARQTMFPSQVPDYLDDDLLGTDSTHAVANFDPAHPLYRAIGGLARLTQRHDALRDGAQIHRSSSTGAGVYAFSRLDRRHPHEYVVALNNSESSQTASVPTYMERGWFDRVYGAGAGSLRSDGAGRLTVQLSALSTVVYRAERHVPRSRRAPDISLSLPGPYRDRLQVAARSKATRSTRSRSSRARAIAGAGGRSAPTTTPRTACSTTSPTSAPARGSSTRPSSSTTPATGARAASSRRRSRRRRSRSRHRPRAAACAGPSRCGRSPPRSTPITSCGSSAR